ncbi:MAG: double-strand break repair protein AddB, partial [Pseudomonadota bacterium]
DEGQRARQRLIHEALAPAHDTAGWSQRLGALAGADGAAGFAALGLAGLTLVDVYDDTEEAEVAALLLREALERPGETAALVTPDAALGRHVAQLLQRWDVHVSPSSGTPLLQTPAGSFAGLVLNWLLDPGDPARLLAVLHHAGARFDKGASEVLDRTALRGVRVWDDLAGLAARIEALRGGDTHRPLSAVDLETSAELVAEIRAALGQAGWTAPAETSVSGADFWRLAEAVMSEMATAPAPWTGAQGQALAQLLSDMASISHELGPQEPRVFVDLFVQEAGQISVPGGKTHPRLAIWGPLESRLQSADHIVLAGLNEGLWPAQPAADAFLPRVMRSDLGLSDPDERIGLSAHDFAQLACAPKVTLLCAGRRDDKPMQASRWLWRLRMLARGALGEAGAAEALSPPAMGDPRVWRKALSRPVDAALPAPVRPQPKPPVEARPKKLSVTRIETLIRDPYAIYCQYVLGLYRLDPHNVPIDARVRGTAIHRALELFELHHAEEGAGALLALLEDELRGGGEAEADLAALRERRRETVAEFLAWRADMSAQIEGRALTEIKGEIGLSIGGRAFQLSGTADRIERRVGGGLAILDFKTGKPPSETQVRAGLAPQMPLQGLIAQRGGYPGVKQGMSVNALTYVQFGSTFDMREIGAGARGGAKPVEEIIAEAEQGLLDLLATYGDPDHPYLSSPIPERVAYASDYERLARRAEWAGLSVYD